jgi:hypothetical protein
MALGCNPENQGAAAHVTLPVYLAVFWQDLIRKRNYASKIVEQPLWLRHVYPMVKGMSGSQVTREFRTRSKRIA